MKTTTTNTTAAAVLLYRKLLQATEPDTSDGISGTSLSPSSTTAVRRPFNPTAPFESSMALTILVLLTALFFMGFFSVYIRRFSAATNQLPSPPSHHRSPHSTYKRNTGGLDPSAVNSLPIVTYGESATHRMIIDDCPICLTEFQEKESVKLIPYCGHVFHPKCIDTWLSAHVTCPVCRSDQLFLTRGGEEVCLDVAGDTIGICLNEVGERSTVDDDDTSRRGEGSYGGVRRTCSCSNLAHHTVLQRSTSF